jgi:hypothetical protein
MFESVGVYTVSLVLLADWTYWDRALFLDRNGRAGGEQVSSRA